MTAETGLGLTGLHYPIEKLRASREILNIPAWILKVYNPGVWKLGHRQNWTSRGGPKNFYRTTTFENNVNITSAALQLLFNRTVTNTLTNWDQVVL